MGEVSNRFSMRSLRSSIAADTISSRFSRHREEETRTAFTSIPRRQLNLVDVQINRPVTRPVTAGNLTSRERKRQRWREKQELRKNPPSAQLSKRDHVCWASLPDLILEHIFQYLSYRDKHSAALVCTWWSKITEYKSVWSELSVHDNMLSHYRFNYGTLKEEAVLDHMRVSAALHAIGYKLKSLSFLPKENLHNIVEFQIVMNRFCLVNNTKLPNIKSFAYKFPCDFARKHNEIDIYGTGGMILQNMKNLLECLPGLERLELIDLQLDGNDAEHVLDEVSEVCRLSLRTLKIVNISRHPFSMLVTSAFVNLRVLVISPHNLGDDLVECIAHMPKLRNLHVLSNAYTECTPTPVDYRIWAQCRRTNRKLRVHLITEGKHEKELTFQTRAPVKSIVYDTPYTRVTQASVNLVVDLYRTDLEVYVHQHLPKFYRPRSFDERPDSCYIYLIRQCPYLHTLMIREVISSSTVLLIAYTGKNLRYFHVRRNGIILKCDWPKSPDWSDEFYTWLKRTSKKLEDVEREISQILGFRWYGLTDQQFKLTHINVNYQHYYEGFEEAV